MGLLFKEARRLLKPIVGSSQPPPRQSVEESTREAAQQVLGNQSKLEAAREGILVQQLHQIAQEELRDVRRLKAKHLGEHWSATDADGDMGHFIICDAYHNNDPPPSRVWPWVAAAMAGGGLGLAALLGSLAIGKLNAPVTTQTPAIQRIENTAGFLLKLEQAPRKKPQ